MIVKTKYLVIRDVAKVDAVVRQNSDMVVIFESSGTWRVPYGVAQTRDLEHDIQKITNAMEVLAYGHVGSELAIVDERLIEPERISEDSIRERAGC